MNYCMEYLVWWQNIKHIYKVCLKFPFCTLQIKNVKTLSNFVIMSYFFRYWASILVKIRHRADNELVQLLIYNF